MSNRPCAVFLPILFAFALCALGSPSLGAQQTHTVDQVVNSFNPFFITIQVGDTIAWKWSGGSHTVTEGKGPPPATGAELFNAPLNVVDSSFEMTFDDQFLCENPRPFNNLYDYYCIPHFSQMKGQFRVMSPWVPLFNALPGTLGEPRLCGFGPLTVGSQLSLELTNLLPDAFGAMFLGLTPGNVPFYGGTLVPFPLQVTLFFNSGPTGEFSGSTLVGPGLGGSSAYLQAGLVDPGAVEGVALSNAIRAKFQ